MHWGVSEPMVAPYGLGKNQILVELPGVDDPGRVRDIIQSTARLEIHLVVSGPYSDVASAGAIPPDQEILPYGGTETSQQGQFYVLQRVACCPGQ